MRNNTATCVETIPVKQIMDITLLVFAQRRGAMQLWKAKMNNVGNANFCSNLRAAAIARPFASTNGARKIRTMLTSTTTAWPQWRLDTARLSYQRRDCKVTSCQRGKRSQTATRPWQTSCKATNRQLRNKTKSITRRRAINQRDKVQELAIQ